MQRTKLAWFTIACALYGCAQKDDDESSFRAPTFSFDAAVDAGRLPDAGALDAGGGPSLDAAVVVPVDAGGGAPLQDASAPPIVDAAAPMDASLGMDASPGDAGTGMDAASDAAADAGHAEGGTGGDAGKDAAIVIPGTAEACADASVSDVVLSLPVCDLCPNAHCVPTNLVKATDPASVDKLGPCGTGDNKCVPDAFGLTRGQVKLKVCKSLLGAEGRCTSICVPMVAAQGSKLPRDTCAEDERCAPCYDPTTGADTGACAVGCTAPPTEKPVTFEKCCSGAGSCVPRDLAGAQASQLNPDSCSDKSGATLCAPDDIASNKPATCRSINDSEGRCLSRCLTTVQSQEDSLPQSSCPSTHLCVPCFDPRSAQATSTGACTLNGDAPVEQPKPFASCCGSDGMCVPSGNVPEAQRANLSQLTCKSGELCTPNAAVANPNGGAFAGSASCQTDISGIVGSLAGGQAGICAPICFQPAAAGDPFLVGGQPLQGTCASASQFCAPCVHPTEGTNTGACPPSP
jgi:hypothetical protein